MGGGREVPMMTILFQLEASYAFDPVEPGSVHLLKVQLDREHGDARSTDVKLELPPGVALDAPPVRTKDRIVWRVKAVEPGPFDWTKVMDESYLPADQRKK